MPKSWNGDSLSYAGDEAFSCLLTTVNCPSSLHQVKSLLFGAAAATNMPLMTDVLKAVWGRETPGFTSDEQLEAFLTNLIGLFNLMSGQQGQLLFTMKPMGAITDISDLDRYAAVRNEEISSFIRGLDLGGTDPTSMTKDARAALRALAEGSAHLDRLRKLTVNGTSAPREDLEGIVGTLQRFDGVLEGAMRVIHQEQKLIKY